MTHRWIVAGKLVKFFKRIVWQIWAILRQLGEIDVLTVLQHVDLHIFCGEILLVAVEYFKVQCRS